jgi:hypothetical protein
MSALTTKPAERAHQVSLKPAGSTTGHVDGAWWPGSRDLPTELPSLLASLAARLEWVERVTYNLTAWAPAPRHLPVGGRAVRLEGFRSQPADVVTVIGRGGRRLTLLVVPPETGPATADRVLARAAGPGNAENVETLLALDGPGTPNGGATAGQRWEGEGGSVST